MIPYVVLLVAVLSLAPLVDAIDQRSIRVTISSTLARSSTVRLLNPFFLLATAALCIFAGFRQGIGRDYYLYESVFSRIVPSSAGTSIQQSPQEIGFTLLVLWVKGMGGGPSEVFLIASIATIVPVAVAIALGSPAASYSLCFFLLYAGFLSPMNTVRQGLAASLVLLACVLWQRQRRLPALILATVAFTIHVSAVLPAAAFLLLRSRRVTSKQFVFLALLSLASSQILRLQFLASLAGFLNPRYAEYLERADGAGLGTAGIFLVQIVVGLIFLQLLPANSDLFPYLNMFLVSVLFTGAGFYALEITRFGEYFHLFGVLVAGALAGANARWQHKVAVVSIGIAYYFLYLSNYGGLLPYSTILRFP